VAFKFNPETSLFMLVLIRKLGKNLSVGLMSALVLFLVSCASQKENVALVDDPNGKKESSVPWNKPEKWENTGPLSGLTDRR
jgi:hypothetical protein